MFGGDNGPGQVAKTEQWNGSSWTETGDLSTARSYLGGTGSTPDSQTALAYGGSAPSQTTATEEWSFPPITASHLQEGLMWFNSTTSTLKGYAKAGNAANGSWGSGGSLNSARDSGAYFGAQSAGVFAGGGGPPFVVEEYNGTSWAEVTDTPMTAQSSSGFGSLTAGLIANAGGGTVAKNTLKYDGTSWTDVADMNTPRYSAGAFGTQTSGLLAGGYAPSPGLPGYDNAETWDGTSWSEVGDLNSERWNLAGAGDNSDLGLVVGGYSGPSTNMANTEKWNGSSWTNVNSLSTGRSTLDGGS